MEKKVREAAPAKRLHCGIACVGHDPRQILYESVGGLFRDAAAVVPGSESADGVHQPRKASRIPCRGNRLRRAMSLKELRRLVDKVERLVRRPGEQLGEEVFFIASTYNRRDTA